MWRFINAALLLYLGIAARKDIRDGTVSIRTGTAFAALAAVIHILEGEDLLWVTGVFPGIFLLGTAWLTRQSVGYGDGCILTVIGLYLGFTASVSILMTALLLLCPVALWTFIRKRDRRETLPFAPFLLAGYLLWLLLERG